jgi:ankyrin repeat protein
MMTPGILLRWLEPKSQFVLIALLVSIGGLLAGCGVRSDTKTAISSSDKRDATSAPEQPLPADKRESPPKNEPTYGPLDVRKQAPTKPKFSDAAFREAARQGDATLIRQALESGNEANAADRDGRTALQLAAFDGHAKVVKLLLDQDAKVNHRDDAGRTALMYAATGANSETVTMLLDAGAETDVADSDEGFTALMFAAAEGQTNVVKILLQYHADASITDNDGDTAQIFAARNGHVEIADLLANQRK